MKQAYMMVRDKEWIEILVKRLGCRIPEKLIENIGYLEIEYSITNAWDKSEKQIIDKIEA